MKVSLLVSTSGVVPRVPARSWRSPVEASVSSTVLGLGSREGRVLGQHPQTRRGRSPRGSKRTGKVRTSDSEATT